MAGEFLWSNGLAEPEDVERLLQPPQGLFRGQAGAEPGAKAEQTCAPCTGPGSS